MKSAAALGSTTPIRFDESPRPQDLGHLGLISMQVRNRQLAPSRPIQTRQIPSFVNPDGSFAGQDSQRRSPLPK